MIDAITFIIGALLGAGLTYVHTKPRKELESICIWKIIKRMYNNYIESKDDKKEDVP